jgi:hypothetical protein
VHFRVRQGRRWEEQNWHKLMAYSDFRYVDADCCVQKKCVVYFGSTLVLVLVELGYCGMLIVGAVVGTKLAQNFGTLKRSTSVR